MALLLPPLAGEAHCSSPFCAANGRGQKLLPPLAGEGRDGGALPAPACPHPNPPPQAEEGAEARSSFARARLCAGTTVEGGDAFPFPGGWLFSFPRLRGKRSAPPLFAQQKGEAGRGCPWRRGRTCPRAPLPNPPLRLRRKGGGRSPFPRLRGKGCLPASTRRPVQPLPPLAGEGRDGGAFRGKSLPPPQPTPAAGEGAKGSAAEQGSYSPRNPANGIPHDFLPM